MSAENGDCGFESIYYEKVKGIKKLMRIMPSMMMGLAK